MKVDDIPYRSIWLDDDGWTVSVIDQTKLPFAFEVTQLATLAQAADAISHMIVRGAPLIGATAAYGLALAMRVDPSDHNLRQAAARLAATRPTAVNLRWAINDVEGRLRELAPGERAAAAYRRAAEICDEDVATNSAIGDHGAKILIAAYEKLDRQGPLNILTHCNAGWLATVDWGTALAPIYKAHDQGVPVHVWVDETRPRNQGSALTAWELLHHGVPHTIIVDNAGGHLMQQGQVDLCITGTDRTTAAGDVANKIGTYLKALAAHDNDIPFYVGLPSPTIDWTIEDGLRDIPIEQRDAAEVTHLIGVTSSGSIETIATTPAGSKAANYAFDVTPARLVTGLITERGVCPATGDGLAQLFPDHAQ